MLSKEWANVCVKKPQGFKSSEEKVPLSKLYDSGYFVSAVFGSEAWVINSKTFFAQPLRIMSNAPSALSKSMIAYNEKQYKKFLVKIEQQYQKLHLLELQRRSQL